MEPPQPGISLCLVLHNHQPVGNFGWVVEEVWNHAYAPFIDAIGAHPEIHVGLHYSGPLLDWIEREHPEAIEQLRALAARGQVEILGGALTEPILVALPADDRLGQLAAMRERVEALFGRAPLGAWLAERVWEPGLASDLARAGYAYTLLDDNHLRAARVAEDGMWGTYSTDDQGRRLTLFGSEQGLRYTIPWSTVETVIDHLRRNATADRCRVGVMGDDGEKFGAWPGTFELCWSRETWVERFLVALEQNADWIRTVSPSEWMADHPPLSRIYVPTSAYVEMTEWALPDNEAGTFHQLIEAARRDGSPAARFLFGASWRNFQARYREINDLAKQMLRVSRAVAAMPPGPARDRATAHLYRGQSNDVYWHGLFGGIYLVHLRMAVLAELIAAEDVAEGGTPRTLCADFDLDGIDEVQLGAPGQLVLVDTAEGAGIGAWDLRASRVALAAVLRRRPESYHRKLAEDLARRAEAEAAEAEAEAADGGAEAAAADVGAEPEGDGTGGVGAAGSEAAGSAAAAGHVAGVSTDTYVPTSSHAVDAALADLLVYDRHELRGGLVALRDAAVGPGLGPRDLAALRDADLGDFADRPFDVVSISDGRLVVRRAGRYMRDGRPAPIVVTKTIELAGERMHPVLGVVVDVANPGPSAVSMELDLSFGWNVSGGGHNPAAFYAWRTDADGMAEAVGTDGDELNGGELNGDVARRPACPRPACPTTSTATSSPGAACHSAIGTPG